MNKADIYENIFKEISSVIDNEPSAIARYASTVCLLHNAFDYYYWTGFYLVDSETIDELVVGPYQGTLGCLRIPFNRGVCGACARTQETQLVPDVHKFPGHIACDSRSNSEIVVPVFGDSGGLVAVLDVDSINYNSFDQFDKFGLEKISSILLKDVSQA